MLTTYIQNSGILFSGIINARLRIYFLQTMPLPCNLPMALFIDRKCKILFDINVWTPLQKSDVSSTHAAHIRCNSHRAHIWHLLSNACCMMYFGHNNYYAWDKCCTRASCMWSACVLLVFESCVRPHACSTRVMACTIHTCCTHATYDWNSWY